MPRRVADLLAATRNLAPFESIATAIRRAPAVPAFALFLGLALVSRLALLRGPIHEDTGDYLYLADRILAGDVPYADVAESFADHASLVLGAVMERDNVNQAVAAWHRVGLAQGILMTRRQLTADQAFALLKRESQNTHVKLRTIAQTVIQTGDLPVDR